AHADSSARTSRDRRRAAVGGEHAVPAAGRRNDSDRPLRNLEHRSFEERVSHGPRPSLWTTYADNLGHPLQLVDARAHERRLLRTHPKFPAPLVPAPDPARRIARRLFIIRVRTAASPRADWH